MIAEMRILRWMSGNTRQNRIWNEIIREKFRVAPIAEKIVVSSYRWFEHVWRRPIGALVKRVDQMDDNPILRVRRRQKKTIDLIIVRDLDWNGLSLDMVYDSTLWFCLIHVADSPSGKRPWREYAFQID